MKKTIMMIALLVMLVSAVSATPEPGAIWTTKGDCGDDQQDVNHFAVGDKVYINGDGFDSGDFDWTVAGQPGQASCDPGSDVASGTKSVGQEGSFCFEAYTVQEGDCGEYTVDFGKKNDNYRVRTETSVPEFGLVGAIMAAGLAGLFVFSKRR